MASRGGMKNPPVPDFHLWDEVTETVTAAAAAAPACGASRAPLPLPPAAPPPPKRPAAPSYAVISIAANARNDAGLAVIEPKLSKQAPARPDRRSTAPSTCTACARTKPTPRSRRFIHARVGARRPHHPRHHRQGPQEGRRRRRHDRRARRAAHHAADLADLARTRAARRRLGRRAPDPWRRRRLLCPPAARWSGR